VLQYGLTAYRDPFTVRWLKMTEVPPHRKFMLNLAYVQMAASTQQLVESHEDDTELRAQVRPRFASDWAHAASRSTFTSALHFCAQVHEELLCKLPFPEGELGNQQKASWLTVVHMERSSFFNRFEKGLLGDVAGRALENTMSRIEAEAIVIDDVGQLASMFNREVSAMFDLHFAAKSSLGMQAAYDLGLAWNASQHEVEHALHTCMSAAPEAVRDCIAAVVASREEMNKRVHRGLEELKQRCSPPLYKYIKGTHTANRALHHQRSVIHTLAEEGIITDLDTAPLICELEERIARMYARGDSLTYLKTKAKNTAARVQVQASNALASTVDHVEHVATKVAQVAPVA
jgi:hypothetical protein